MIVFAYFLKERGAKSFICFLTKYLKVFCQKVDSAWGTYCKDGRKILQQHKTADNLYGTGCLLCFGYAVILAVVFANE